MARLRCWLRGRHEPDKQLIGGYRCRDCGAAGAGLKEMGTLDDDRVGPVATTFDRRDGGVTKSERWER